jgi:2-polyprenyl-6-methoxyphenol hydroxylase-like FAD-dependent oxidoreductase
MLTTNVAGVESGVHRSSVSRQRDPVLVVGAGPVGLTAALMLAWHGTAVRIIDRDEGPTPLSKATVVWQRTMETLGSVLPYERFSMDHPVLQQVLLRMGTADSSVLDFPSKPGEVPACVLVPQSATERILITRLAELGVIVERRCELTGLRADHDGVSCEIAGSGGVNQVVRAPWLVACDGAHSTVRHRLSLTFPGDTVNSRWMLADFEIAADPQPSDRQIHIDLADGIAALFPMGAGRWRLIASLAAHPDASEGALRKFDVEQVQAVLDNHTDLGWKITTCHWTSDFGVNERQVEQYVHGRILLAGDAAHVHSPFGGQGMNTGMQDVANLAWKIALVERGAASASLLGTYHAERHPVAAAAVRQSGALLKAAMATGPLRFGRDHLAPIALSVPALRKKFVSFLTEESITYHNGPLADGTGNRHGVRSGECWPLTPGAQAELILLGDAADDEAPDTFGGANGLPLTVTRAVVNEHIAEALGSDSGAVLVRPDGVVASVGKDAQTVTAWISENIQMQQA